VKGERESTYAAEILFKYFVVQHWELITQTGYFTQNFMVGRKVA
jgi:hypothetical protein